MSLSRWDYLGRDRFPCHECGDYFIKSDPRENEHIMCSQCGDVLREQLVGPFDTVYRALRPEEDVINDGIRPENPDAKFSLEDHILNGSREATQFVSFTWSLEVAMFYAIKGYIEQNDRPARVAVVELPLFRLDTYQYDIEQYAADGWFRDQRARNYARTFQEVCVTYNTVVEKVLVLPSESMAYFTGHTGRFADFRDHYTSSPLAIRVRNSAQQERTVKVEVDLVDLHHYRASRPRGRLSNIRLFLEDDNVHDSDAVRVDTMSRDPPSEWTCIGHLSPEHAAVIRKFF